MPVALRQVELAQIDLDHLDAERWQSVGLDCAADLGDQVVEPASADFGRDERGERVVAERGADLGEHDVGELEVGACGSPDRLEEPPGVGDPPEREAANHDVLLVGGEIFGLARPGIKQPAVDRQHAIERQLEVEARRLDHADDLAEPADHAVLGDIDREQRTVERHEQERGCEQEEQAPDSRRPGSCQPVAGRRHLAAAPSGSRSHRSSSFRSSAPGRTNFCTPGSTASIVSSCRRKRVSSGARR